MQAAIQIGTHPAFPEQADYAGKALSFNIDDPDSVAAVEALLQAQFGLSHRPVVHGRRNMPILEWIRAAARELFGR